MGAGDEFFKIVQRAIVGIHRVIIPDGIRTAEFALAEFFADGMNGHRPENIHPETVQLIQLRRDAVQIAGGGKIARENLINGAGAQPVRETGGRGRETSATASAPGENKANAAARENQPLVKRRKFIDNYGFSTAGYRNRTKLRPAGIAGWNSRIGNGENLPVPVISCNRIFERAIHSS